MTATAVMPGANGAQRARFGCTMTFRCLATGDVVTRRVEGLSPLWQKRRARSADPTRGRIAAGMGSFEDASKGLLRYMRGKTDRVWVVQAYSSPETVYRDIARGRGHDPRGFANSMPELLILGKLKEYRMAAPELFGSTSLRKNDAMPKLQVALLDQARRLGAYAERGPQ